MDFDALRVRLASPDEIREMSHGEVKKSETVTIGRTGQNLMVCSVKEYSVPRVITSVRVVSTKAEVRRASV